MNLPHPACIFWGEELAIIQNSSWEKLTGSPGQQGKIQRDLLPVEALSLIRTAMLGKARRCLDADIFAGQQANDCSRFEAILSPIMNIDKPVSGAVIQLLEMNAQAEAKKDEKRGIMDQVHAILNDSKNNAGNKSIFDGLPLDENPFFQRFASMLPTGLAILNSKAEAVFVNEQFFELTTSIQQNFKSWPQSIHPDDYDRVMDAYQKCFNGSGETLRIEFRTQGQKDPWRLLLLTPLGDKRKSGDNYVGFICAVIDITPNKAQELAQRQAAQEAIERKNQQERFIEYVFPTAAFFIPV